MGRSGGGGGEGYGWAWMRGGAQRHPHGPIVLRPHSYVGEERCRARHALHLGLLLEERMQVLDRLDGHVAVAVKVGALLSAQQDDLARCSDVQLELRQDLQCKYCAAASLSGCAATDS